MPINRRPWRRLGALVFLTALAAAFRFWKLDQTPPGFHYDEAYEALEAWRVLTQPGYHPIFFPGNFGVEPMFIYLTSLAFRLFGANPLVMRGVAAVAGTLTVPSLYLLGEELVRAEPRIPPALPFLSALVLATLRWHVLFSRVGIEPVLVPLLLVIMLWALWRGVRTNQLLIWAVLGLVTGLTPYTYPAGRLLPVLLALSVVWIWLVDRGRLRGRWRGVLLAGLVSIVVVAPLVWHWVQHPDQLFLRSSQIAVSSEASAQGGLGDNLRATLGMFSLAGDTDARSNVPGLPVLDVAMSLAFYLGLAFVIWRWKRPALSGLLLAGGVMLAPTIFSEYAPHFRRALGAAPVVALMSGVGLAWLAGVGASRTMAAARVGPRKEVAVPAGSGGQGQKFQMDSRLGVTLSGLAPKHSRPGAASEGSLRAERGGDSSLEARRQRSSVAHSFRMTGSRWIHSAFLSHRCHLIERQHAAKETAAIVMLSGPTRQSTLRQGTSEASLATWFQSGLGRVLPAARLLLVGLIVVVSAGFSARDYFVRWGSSSTVFYAYDQGLWEIGQYVRSLPAGQRVYLSPRPASDMTLAFAWREGPDVRHFDGRHALVAPAFPPAATGDVTYIIVEHEDFRGSALLRELYPQAKETRTFLDRQGQVYARAFTVSPAGPTTRQPQHTVTARWSDFELIGYDLNLQTLHPGDTIYLQLWWRVLQPVKTDWTVFTHLLGEAHAAADGQQTTQWGGQDSCPGAGSAPTTTWAAGDLVLDEYQIRVPDDARPGVYTLEAGLYNPVAGDARAQAVDPPGADHVTLGQVEVR